MVISSHDEIGQRLSHPISLGDNPAALEAVRLRQTIAAQFGDLDPAQILVVNSGPELMRSLLRPMDRVVMPQYTHRAYRDAAAQAGASSYVVEVREPDLKLEVRDILQAIDRQTKFAIISQPADIPGSYLSLSQLRTLEHSLPTHVTLFIDASLSEFVRRPDYDTGLSLVSATNHVMVLRSFKAYGLDREPVAWAYVSPALLPFIAHVSAPSPFSATAAREALADPFHMQELVNYTLAQKSRIERSLCDLDLPALPSWTNAITVPLANPRMAHTLRQVLFEHGNIRVRSLARYGWDRFLQISVGDLEQNQRLTTILQDYFRPRS